MIQVIPHGDLKPGSEASGSLRNARVVRDGALQGEAKKAQGLSAQMVVSIIGRGVTGARGAGDY